MLLKKLTSIAITSLILISVEANANNIEKNLNWCLKNRLSGSSFERDIPACGRIIQEAQDQEQNVNINNLLSLLNEKITLLNKKFHKDIKPYSIYVDKIDSNAKRNIRVINLLREDIEKYSTLNFSIKGIDSYESIDDMNFDFARVNTKRSSTYTKIQRNLKKLKSKAPSFDLTKYENKVSKLHGYYEAQNALAEFTIQIAKSTPKLEKISKYKRTTGSNTTRKEHWSEVVSYLDVKKLINSSYYQELKPTLDLYFEQYTQAKESTEKQFLSDFLMMHYEEATIFNEPTGFTYYTPEKVDASMQQALMTLKKEIKDWNQFIPNSELLARYEQDLSKTESFQKKAIEEGHQIYKGRILSELDAATAPEVDFEQNRVDLRSVYSASKRLFEKHAPLIDALGNKTKANEVALKPMQTEPWGVFVNALTKVPVKQATKFITVVEDSNGGCHAVSLKVEKNYLGGNSWSKAIINDYNQDYPMQCNKL